MNKEKIQSLEKEAQAKQAMYDEKYTEIHKANVVLMDERDIIRKENDSLWVENEDLTRKLENPAQKIINKQAHDNAIRKLNEANERIVEFEDIKKSHLKVQEELKKKLEKADFLARAFAKECPDSEKARAYLKENE